MEEIVLENSSPKKDNRLTREKKRLIFYVLMLILPLAQFLIFYVYVNISSILLGFQKYTEKAGSIGYDITFTWDNYIYVFNFLAKPHNLPLITNSLIYFVIHLGIGTTLALVFSYYIYKQYALSQLFRVILFLPQVISGLVLSLLFNYIVEDVYVSIFNLPKNQGLMTNPDTQLGALIFYNLWLGFGTNILLYCGAMSGIDPSITEASELDGVNVIQEFFYITFPMIFSTFTTFIIANVASMFTQTLHLYTIYASNAPDAMRTLGYHIQISTLNAGLAGSNSSNPNIPYFSHPQLSALGLIITLVMLPITFGIRAMLERFGPSVN